VAEEITVSTGVSVAAIANETECSTDESERLSAVQIELRSSEDASF
jgi:hypothetical protein